jgi:HAD superfamily hydrolase (TIGR01484 family)
MTKTMIAFDLDDTLAITKSPISGRMAQLLTDLLSHYEVCIISGGNLDQFKMQVIDELQASATALTRLHLMPTCGTQYYRYDGDDWQRQYSNDLTIDQKVTIIYALTAGAKELDLWEAEPHGEIIEDRGSQMTFSALGQQAPAEAKYAWDPDMAKRRRLRDFVAPLLPSGIEIRIGGTTSVDVTIEGIDKAYGMRQLMEHRGITMTDILFIGDKLEEGGNDHPVKAMGIDTIAVEKWQDTAMVIEALIKVA